MAQAYRITDSESWKPGVSARQAYTIVGAKNMTEAWVASGLPMVGSTYTRDSRLVAQVPEIRQKKLLFEADFEYIPLQFDPKQQGEKSQELLSLKPKYQWASERISEEVDADWHGNTLTNSAGDPINPVPMMDWGYRTLTITRYESGYDFEVADSFEDTLNADTIIIPRTGGIVIDPGHMRCLSICPADSYDEDTPVIPMVYRFALMSGDNPWEFQFQDMGKNGYYLSSATTMNKDAIYCRDSGKQVETDVALNGKANPIDTVKYCVGWPARAAYPASFPTAPGSMISSSTQYAVTLKYWKYGRMPFRSLGLFE